MPEGSPEGPGGGTAPGGAGAVGAGLAGGEPVPAPVPVSVPAPVPVLTPVAVRVRRLLHGHGLDLPAYATSGAAGMDVLSAENLVLRPGARHAVATGLALAIPPGYEIQVRPRSGLALKHGITVPNTPGTIDSDYRGELKIILINHSPDNFSIRRGDRIAQLVLAPVIAAHFVEVEELDETLRGEGGFGSTGGMGAPAGAAGGPAAPEAAPEAAYASLRAKPTR